jgi:hypothetical protein
MRQYDITPWKTVHLKMPEVFQIVTKFPACNQYLHKSLPVVPILKVKVKFTLEQTTKAQTASKGTDVLLL